MCNKVWAKVNTQIRNSEIFQLKADKGVRVRLLKEATNKGKFTVDSDKILPTVYAPFLHYCSIWSPGISTHGLPVTAS